MCEARQAWRKEGSLEMSKMLNGHGFALQRTSTKMPKMLRQNRTDAETTGPKRKSNSKTAKTEGNPQLRIKSTGKSFTRITHT